MNGVIRASVTGNGALGRRIVAGAAFVFALSASSGAIAACTGTAGGLDQFLPFASGGAVNSLVSAINASNTAFLTQSTAFVGAPANPAPDQEGGGVWVRGIGGEVTTKNTTTTSNLSLGVGGPAVPLPGTVTCDNSSRLSFSGVQIGTDTARLNWNGWNVHVGTTIGYLGAKARDRSTPGALNPMGGTFEDSLQVPFVGVYAAATRGGFFIDGQVRFDYYQNTLNDPIVSGIFNQKLDARGLSFAGNIGYHHQLGNNWFIEPSAGIVVSRVEVDPLNITGTAILPPPATGIYLPGRLQVDDIHSTLGRLSLRAGTTVVSGNVAWQPFVTASVYHEFEGGVTARFSNYIAGFDISGDVSTTSIGTYGQFGLGVAAQVLNTGWLGYLRADYRTGSRIEGYSLNGGLRYQFSPEQIAGGSLFTKAPAMAAAAPYNWTGFYIGASAGVLNGKNDLDFGAPFIGNTRYAGFAGGGQIGYDWQIGKWVVGLEGALSASNANGARPCPSTLGLLYTCENGMDWLGTATAKLGYTLWDRSLLYVRAGAAFGNTKLTMTCNTGPYSGALGIPGCGINDSKTAAGWTVGYGTEFALTRNWTVRAESNYFDLGTERYTLREPGTTIPVDVRNRGFISTVGLNYRVPVEPVLAARY